MGLGNEEQTLKTSRAYIAGLGTTGVLIASFFMLLTVGSTLVAFRGVPGAPSNGDLSSIELRQQRESAQRSATLIASSDVLGESGSRDSAGSGGVLGARASGSDGWPAGQIQDGVAGSAGPDALQAGPPRKPLAEKEPPGAGPAPAPGSGVVEAPVAPGTPPDDGSGTDSGSGSGSGSDSGSGTGTGSGSDSGSGSGSGTGSGTGSGSGSDSGSGGSGSGSGSSGGSGSTDSGSGSGSGSGTGSGVGDTVEDVTDTAGSTVGTVSPGGAQAIGDVGSAAGGLLEDVTSTVGGLTGGIAGTD